MKVGETFLFKGTLLGAIVGVLITLWVTIGSMTMHHKHPPLRPLSVERCSLGNSTTAFLTPTLNYNNYTYSVVSDEV